MTFWGVFFLNFFWGEFVFYILEASLVALVGYEMITLSFTANSRLATFLDNKKILKKTFIKCLTVYVLGIVFLIIFFNSAILFK